MRQLAATFTLDPAQMNPLLFHSNGSYQGAADEDRVTFMAPGAWTAETTEPWIHLDKVSGQGDATNSQYVLVTVDVNAGTQARQGKVRILGGETPLEVLVQQQGEFLELQYNNYDFDGGSALPNGPNDLEAFIQVSSSDPNWTVQVLQDAAGWLLASKATIAGGSITTYELRLVAQMNGSEVRVGTVRVTNPSGLSRDLVVSQQPYGDPGAEGSNSGWVAPKLEVWSPDGSSTEYTNSTLPLTSPYAVSFNDFKVKSTSNWSATLPEGCTWINLETLSGIADSDNGTNLSFNVLANNSLNSRYAYISLTNTQGVEKWIKVEQPGVKMLDVLKEGSTFIDINLQTEEQTNFTLKVKSHKQWTVSPNNLSWISFTTTGNANIDSGTDLEVHIEENTTGSPRSALVTVSNGESTSVSFYINQPKDSPVLKFHQGSTSTPEITEYTFSASQQSSPGYGQPNRITLEANRAWAATVTEGDAWLSLASGSQTGTETQILTVNVAGNAGPARQGTIKVSSLGIDKYLTVKQNAGELGINEQVFVLARTGVSSTNSADRRIQVVAPDGVEWSVNTGNKPSWINTNPNPAKGTGDGNIYFGATDNNLSDPISGIIEITMGTQKKQIGVVQNSSTYSMPFIPTGGSSLAKMPYFYIDNNDLSGSKIKRTSSAGIGAQDIIVNFKAPETANITVKSQTPNGTVENSSHLNDENRSITLNARSYTAANYGDATIVLEIKYLGETWTVTLIQD